MKDLSITPAPEPAGQSENAMPFEPQKFFIGLIDFFAVWLPGALLVYLVKNDLGPRILGTNFAELDQTSGWVVFLFSSYLLGHFVFLIGSYLLDDKVYDRIRGATDREMIGRLATGSRPAGVIFQWLARRLMGNDEALRHAIKIREHHLSPDISPNALNTFQWSKARLTLESPQVMESIQRFEADSKFFRSLVIVCLIIVALFVTDTAYRFLSGPGLVHNISAFTVVAIPVGIMAFLRYVEQRLKATKQAYAYIITLEPKSARHELPSSSIGDLTHAGGIVYRHSGGKIEYLLVQATEPARDWVLPKGHIEPGEDPGQTAVREVHEEAGLWLSLGKVAGDARFRSGGHEVVVRYFLMECAASILERAASMVAHWSTWAATTIFRRTLPAVRKKKWVSFEAAYEELKPESREVLNTANRQLGREVLELDPENDVD